MIRKLQWIDREKKCFIRYIWKFIPCGNGLGFLFNSLFTLFNWGNARQHQSVRPA